MSLFSKHPALIVWREEPFNAETPLELLGESPVTPNELFYVRNHAPVPEVDPASYRLPVTGLVAKPLSLSLPELRERFPSAAAAATLACAGNRRAQLAEVAAIPGETPWGAGAIGSAVWTGVRLRDVLLFAGVEPGAAHVAFTGLDRAEQDGAITPFGGSIPLEKALGPEVLLAYEMNGEPLPAVHGFPLRVVVPGYIGARSVKWLSAITVQAERSSNFFQARDYTISGRELSELAVNSAVCRPGEGKTVSAPRLVARGYAIAGRSSRLDRVELSVDRGESWAAADLRGPDDPWAWRLWEAELEVVPGPGELLVRARDSGANVQPPDPASVWNARGYMNNAWHRVRFSAVER